MKRYFFLCLILCTVISRNVSAFEIVINGHAKATIIIPKFENAPVEEKWTKKAAGWLTDYVKQSTGAELKTVEEGQPVEGNIISIGHTKMAQAAGIKTDDLQWDSCRLIVKGNTLFLIGLDTFGPVPDDHLGAKGNCKAVTTFLEDFVGVKWFIPSPMGELVPQKKDIVVPDDLSKEVNAVFCYGMLGGGSSRFWWDKEQPGGFANNWRSAIIMYRGGHGWNHFVPADKYFKDHPEYFALINGKRTDKGNHLCTSNPEVKEILIREIRKKFDEGYDLVPLGQSDGFKRCECEKCEALDDYKRDDLQPTYSLETQKDHPCERIHLLHKAIIEACKQSHPNKKVHLMVYAPSTQPSKKFDIYGDNVITETCHYYPYTLPLWAPKVAGSTGYLYWWGTYNAGGIDPKFGPKQVARFTKFLRDNKVIGIYQCGGGHNWGLEGPAYYTAGRLMGNPDIDLNSCVREYCDFVYGNASNTMVKFFDLLYSRIELIEQRIQPVWTWDIKMDTKKTYEVKTLEVFYLDYLPANLITKLDNMLTKAEKQAEGERAKCWLKLTRYQFEFTKANILMYRAYDDFKRERTLLRLKRVKEHVLNWKAARDKLLSYGSDEKYAAVWFPEWKQVKTYFEKNGFSTISEPVTLDFDKLEKELKEKDVE